MFVVEKLGVELDPEEGLRGVLHRLDGASLIGRREPEIGRQFLNLVAVGMPDSYRVRKAPEDPARLTARQFHREKPAFAKCPYVALAWSGPLHEAHGRAERDRDLLVPSADSQDWLPGLPDNFKYAAERFGLVVVPGVTLAAENDVARLSVSYELRGNISVRFDNNIEIGADPRQGSSQFPRAGPLAVNCVVN
ncbi:MAG: hypothetical protein QOE77_1273 [Blastocatellia bacterium]|nr:hypothetical protein [Blastocatellia bacterium]